MLDKYSRKIPVKYTSLGEYNSNICMEQIMNQHGDGIRDIITNYMQQEESREQAADEERSKQLAVCFDKYRVYIPGVEDRPLYIAIEETGDLFPPCVNTDLKNVEVLMGSELTNKNIITYELIACLYYFSEDQKKCVIKMHISACQSFEHKNIMDYVVFDYPSVEDVYMRHTLDLETISDADLQEAGELFVKIVKDELYCQESEDIIEAIELLRFR